MSRSTKESELLRRKGGLAGENWPAASRGRAGPPGVAIRHRIRSRRIPVELAVLIIIIVAKVRDQFSSRRCWHDAHAVRIWNADSV
jgi:hypothetical protein